MTEKSKPIINQISTPKELDKLRSENDLVYALYLSNEDGMNLDIYKGSAFSYYRIPFVYVIGDTTIKAVFRPVPRLSPSVTRQPTLLLSTRSSMITALFSTHVCVLLLSLTS